jgi:hypothetical protein
MRRVNAKAIDTKDCMSNKFICLLIAVFSISTALRLFMGSTQDIKKRTDISEIIKKKKLVFVKATGIFNVIAAAFAIIVALIL